MAKIVYSEEAFADFERIIEFLLETSAENAAQVLDYIAGAIGILERHPLIGRRIDVRLRELIISRGATGYIALYRHDPGYDVVRTLRIRHHREAGYRE